MVNWPLLIEEINQNLNEVLCTALVIKFATANAANGTFRVYRSYQNY